MTSASSVRAENLAGKRALVTGGTRGTGATVAARLKAAGAHVTAIGRHAVEHLATDEFAPTRHLRCAGSREAVHAEPQALPSPWWEYAFMDPSNTVVRRFVAALNAGDQKAFFAVLTPDATMSDDGSERALAEWTDREIFSSSGHLEVESEAADGLSLIARYSNSMWGEMRTRWRFELSGDRIARFETGQA